MGKKLTLEHVTLLKNHMFSNYLSFTKSQTLTDDQKGIAKTNLDIKPSVAPIVSTTYAAIKSLRDNSQLVAGQFYRITDYVTTTKQANTISANHPFDIIVLATDTNQLNEQAWATQHEGDAYFANSRLDAWKIWYALDNDSYRFSWAFAKIPLSVVINGGKYYRYPKKDNPSFEYGLCWRGNYTNVYSNTENPIANTDLFATEPSDTGTKTCTKVDDPIDNEGKGVIYRMIDEFGNDCPYDFKNIQFYRRWDNNLKLWATIDSYGVPAYTFSSEGTSTTTSFTDNSLIEDSKVVNNIIRPDDNYQYKLNNICFFCNEARDNVIDDNCYNCTIGNYSKENFIGTGCYNIKITGANNNKINQNSHDITINQYCQENIIGNKCYNIVFGQGCTNNTMNDACTRITMGTYCYNNTFGVSASNNTLGNSCTNNEFGMYSLNNTLGESSSYNAFKQNSAYNVLGTNCTKNIFEIDAYDCKLGNNSASNIISVNCARITLGESCSYNIFNNNCTDIKCGNYCESNLFGATCKNITLASNEDETVGNNFSYNKFEAGCSYIIFYNEEEASYTDIVMNYIINKSVSGDWTTKTKIVADRDNNVEINIAKNSNGDIKQYCVADLIN